MLFLKPLSALTHGDIRQFCLQFSEGLRVEYKREFDISMSFTNEKTTLGNLLRIDGGVLIIGVNTRQSVPVEPIEGFDLPNREELPQ